VKLLLDTHTFMWWDSDPRRIPADTFSLMQQPDNHILVSLVSLWEIQIKTQLGKLQLRTPLSEIILYQQSENGITLLSITLQHIMEIDNLSLYHKDPFDRLLIAQSRIETATLISRGSVFKNYDCQVIW
jgi:PIN domain nuclease of toxin-antitoxin system